MWKKIKEIPLGDKTWINLITILFSGLAIIVAGVSAHYASRAAAEPAFIINFTQSQVKPFSVLNPPSSVRVYRLIGAPGYKDPPNTWANDIVISNVGKVWAQNVTVTLRLKEPFIFVNVYFDEEPQGKWRVTPNESTYRLVTLERLEPIGPKPSGRIRVSFVYTFPRNPKRPDGAIEPGALEVGVRSGRMQHSGATIETYSLKYWGDGK